MKLMFVLSRVPFPLDKGDKLRAYHILKHLSKANEIFLFCISEDKIAFDVKEHLLDLCREVHVFPISKSASLLSAAKNIFSSKPFQAVYFYNAGYHAEIIAHASRIKPDKILFQLVRTAEYANGIESFPKVIDYMDAFSRGYERMSAKSTFFKGWLYNEEAKRLKKYEEIVFNLFQGHLIISERDKALINHPQSSEIRVIPNGVDSGYFTPVNHTKKYDLLFHGNMNYLPNIDCAVYVAEKILPELSQRGREFSFLISGASPNKRVTQLASDKNITVTGWLDDVRSSYSLSNVFIAPLEMGTGIQNKLLEAMAMGIPCVVSALAADALGLIHHEHVLIGNSTEEYCTHIEELYQDNVLRNRLIQNSLRHVRQNYRWEDSVSRLEEFISSSIA